ncbi:MAG: exosortase/archaeosortase family protein [Verrucomicrobiales bacterium]|nr:exosortase/archaeosortase family protein [Verrucomicrobiales bacterium]
MIESQRIHRSRMSVVGEKGSFVICLSILLSLGLWMLWQPFDAGYADYRRTILQTLLIYWKDPTWQHGALAPLVAGWLVWRQRGVLNEMTVKGSIWGLVLLIGSGLFYYAGYKANSFYLGAASVQIFLAGAVIWILGWKQAKLLTFPWLILLFSWPLLFLEETIAFHLRLVMVKATSAVLNGVGVATFNDGTALLSAASNGKGAGDLFRLDIDAPCSGMRSLFALMMVSALFAYFRQKSLGSRLFLFFCSIPIAVVANLVRLLVLVFATMLFGQEFAVGDQEREVSTFHFLSGVVVFVVALVILQGVSNMMDWLQKKRGKE